MTDTQLKILLVEDDKLAQLAAKINLQQANCSVDLAVTGKEAIELTTIHAYHLIFMDIGLDDMNGFDVAKIIRTTSAKNSKTPLIALTAHSDTDSEYKIGCLESGMNDYLVKPLTLEQVQYIFNKFSLYNIF